MTRVETLGYEEQFDALWNARVEALLEEALDMVRSGSEDPIPTISAADAAARVAAGELPWDEMEGYPFPGEPDPLDDPARCICPPGLVERGGFKGGCLVHGRVYL